LFVNISLFLSEILIRKMKIKETHYVTPTEFLEAHPETPWTPQQIGWLLKLGLVKGRKVGTSNLVNEKHVLAHLRIQQKLSASENIFASQ